MQPYGRLNNKIQNFFDIKNDISHLNWLSIYVYYSALNIKKRNKIN